MVENLKVMLRGMVLTGMEGEAVVTGDSVVISVVALMLSTPIVLLAVMFDGASVVPGEVTDPGVVMDGVVGSVKTDCVVDDVVPCNIVTMLCGVVVALTSSANINIVILSVAPVKSVKAVSKTSVTSVMMVTLFMSSVISSVVGWVVRGASVVGGGETNSSSS